jgi:hypothetical protein
VSPFFTLGFITFALVAAAIAYSTSGASEMIRM